MTLELRRVGRIDPFEFLTPVTPDTPHDDIDRFSEEPLKRITVESKHFPQVSSLPVPETAVVLNGRANVRQVQILYALCAARNEGIVPTVEYLIKAGHEADKARESRTGIPPVHTHALQGLRTIADILREKMRTGKGLDLPIKNAYRKVAAHYPWLSTDIAEGAETLFAGLDLSKDKHAKTGGKKNELARAPRVTTKLVVKGETGKDAKIASDPPALQEHQRHTNNHQQSGYVYSSSLGGTPYDRNALGMVVLYRPAQRGEVRVVVPVIPLPEKGEVTNLKLTDPERYWLFKAMAEMDLRECDRLGIDRPEGTLIQQWKERADNLIRMVANTDKLDVLTSLKIKLLAGYVEGVDALITANSDYQLEELLRKLLIVKNTSSRSVYSARVGVVIKAGEAGQVDRIKIPTIVHPLNYGLPRASEFKPTKLRKSETRGMNR